MATHAEIAAERERRALRRAGIDPDNMAANPAGGEPRGRQEGDDDENDDDDDDYHPEGGSGAGGDDDIDPVIAERDQLRQQLAALQGRVAPAQQQSEEFRRLWQAEQQQREAERVRRESEIAELRRQLEERNTATAVEELLTEEERNMVDPAMLGIITKIADNIATRRAPKVDVRAETQAVLAEREAERVRDYRTRVLSDPSRGLSQLYTLVDNPAFQDWARNEENDDFDPLMTSLMNARSTEEIDRYAKAVAKRIAKFNGGKKQPANRSTDPKVSLGDRMRRAPQGRMTEEERNTKLAQARQLARSRNPQEREKAMQILNQLQ